MREKTIDGLLAEIEELRAWKQAAITEQVKWLEWANKLLGNRALSGDSLFESTVKYVDELKSRNANNYSRHWRV